MSRLSRQTPKSRMTGVGMLEILIALLVVAIGVLGLAQLQGVATRQNHNAYLRSQATILAYSIADRMRANLDNAPSYDIALTSASPSNPPACTSGSRRDQDLCTWLNALNTLLPAGDGAVNNSLFPLATITVQYNTVQYDYDQDQPNAPASIQVVVDTQLFDPNPSP